MAPPAISIITPSLNQGEFIGDAIDSVLSQAYPRFEHIVVDGGSTDQTVDTIRRYGHLRWTSAPNDGQADALNKGLSLATGEIVAFLGADEFYAPGAFRAVVGALASHPVVMGMCRITDRAGHPTDLTENVEHSWFDILKYWVYDSIPTRAAVFATRSQLESVRRPDGQLFDASLRFLPEMDLWLRIARTHSFSTRVNAVTSNYRVYEANESGHHWDLAFNEASRIFSRHSRAGSTSSVTFVVPLADGRIVNQTLEALSRQSLRTFETVIAGTRPQGDVSSILSRLGVRHGGLSLHYARARSDSMVDLLECGRLESEAPIVCVVPPGLAVGPDLCNAIANRFASDSVGAAVSFEAGAVPISAKWVMADPIARISSIIALSGRGTPIAVRTVALNELASSTPGPRNDPLAAMLLRLVHRGWRVVAGPSQELDGSIDEAAKANRGPSLLAATMIMAIAKEYEEEPFARVRAAHGFGLQFLPGLIESARAVVGSAER